MDLISASSERISLAVVAAYFRFMLAVMTFHAFHAFRFVVISVQRKDALSLSLSLYESSRGRILMRQTKP